MSNPFENLFSKFSKTRKLIDKEVMYGFYEQVSKEIQSGQKDEGVWAKAFSDSEGDEQKAKAIYIELMVEKMVLAYEARLELEKASEKEKQIAEKEKQDQIAYNQPDDISEREQQKQWDDFTESTSGYLLSSFILIVSGAVTFYLWNINFINEWYWAVALFVTVFFIFAILSYVVFSAVKGEEKETRYEGQILTSEREQAIQNEREFIKREVAKSKSRDAEAAGNKQDRLKKLQDLFDKELVSKEDYEATRKRILSE